MQRTVGFIKKFVERTLRILLVCAGFFSIVAFFGQHDEIIDALANFRALFVIVFAIFALLFLGLRSWRDAFVALGLVLLNASTFLMFYIKDPTIAAADSMPVRVLAMNVWGGVNHDWDKTVDVIRKDQPDFIGLSEVTATWEKALRKSLTEYPYQVYEPNFGGIALLSKHPLKNSKVEYCGKVHRPRISADINVGGQMIRVLVVHTIIPIVHDNNRDRELAEVGQEIKNGQGPAIVFGDLNITPWSKPFEKLLKTAELRDSERGFGFQPSWHVGGPSFFPIDHCLVSKDFTVADRKTLQSVGSDHYPLLIDLKLTRQ